jgi:hypothetical protein
MAFKLGEAYHPNYSNSGKVIIIIDLSIRTKVSQYYRKRPGSLELGV